MAIASWPQALTTPQTFRMRAVIADSDPFRRRLLRHSLLGDNNYELVGEAASASELMGIIEREVPELAVCHASVAAEGLRLAEPWPVFLTVGGQGGVASERVVGNVALPCQPSDVADALATAGARILHRKALELGGLIRSYLVHGGKPNAPVLRIDAEQEDGRRVSVSTADILWIKAAGNYVQLFTAAGAFELRDTISNLAERLEPSGFLRIHRCAIVNRAAIAARHLHDSPVASVQLRDGTHLFVGPKFRDRLAAREENALSSTADVVTADM